MSEDKAGQELSLLLEHAADDKPGAVAAFFDVLLRSQVYVAIKPGMSGGEAKDVGKTSAESQGFVTVIYDSKECLPIFSEESFVSDWAKEDVEVEKRELKALLWTIGDDTWMYLNPNQEIGKEITAWEVEQLRKGADAIPELVSALEDAPYAEVEIRTGEDLFPEFKQKLRSVMEICPRLDEAFLVAVKEGGSEEEKPLVGLKYRDASDAEKKYIREEIDECAAAHLKGGHSTAVVIDDLDKESSPNHALFEDAVPFYISPQMPQKPSALQRAASSVLGIFSPPKGMKLPNDDIVEGEIVESEVKDEE